VDALRGWLGATAGDAPIAMRTRLRARIGALGGPDRSTDLVPLLGHLLGLRMDVDDEARLEALTGGEFAAATRDAYAGWIEALAATGPVILAVDDLHHADPASMALAEELLAVTDRAAFVLAVTTGPGSDLPAWSFRARAMADYAHRLAEVSLRPLSPGASEELLGELVPFGLLPSELRAEVVARAEGNPLFLQELARALVEGGDRRRTWSVAPASMADLPPAVEGLLVARIDRLSEDARAIAQAAAVIGREFQVPVLASVLERPDVDLTPLLRADVVREVARFPELVCTFSHGLLHEAVLATLTPTTLRSLSGRVGRALEERYADSIDQHADALAFHLYRSDDAAKAVTYLELAADLATADGDAERAARLLERARKAAEVGSVDSGPGGGPPDA
jgi:predicted ATPase